ncbi:MAG: peptidoglycan DD-metalloendopeptidase family protein [Lewinellaceae bacterium]|nr:peptidoglycan DD-metalloendopeptidase family protein [Lewinellaceae bacterium]
MKYRRTTAGWTRRLLVLVCLLLFSGITTGLYAQSKKSLEDKRRKLIREISQTDKLLKKTTKTKETTYDRFIALQSQIERRGKLIETIGLEIDNTQAGIEQNSGVIEALNRDLQAMREEYGRLIRYAFRRKMMSNPLLFILSAENLNQAFRRWLFLIKYDRFRKEQARLIEATQTMLQRKIVYLENTRQEKEQLLASLQQQKATLGNELEQKDNLLKTLTKDEESLKADLITKQKAHEALNQTIERIIQEEVRKQVEAARKPRASTPASEPEASTGTGSVATTRTAPASSPDAVAVLSSNFGKNQGKLPWPVESGFISRSFGRQKHPTIKSVEITNNGIDIRTEEGSPVKAVFEGIVAGVQFIPGHDYTVILQHGEYYTVYSNIEDTSLSKGDQVKANQNIGRVSTNPITGTSELHFELWEQKERQNPAAWIRK